MYYDCAASKSKRNYFAWFVSDRKSVESVERHPGRVNFDFRGRTIRGPNPMVLRHGIPV